jgi:hypothetical protein
MSCIIDYKLKIVKCDDPQMWYADKVGETVPYLETYEDENLSLEPGGFTNIVKKEDAELIRIKIKS